MFPTFRICFLPTQNSKLNFDENEEKRFFHPSSDNFHSSHELFHRASLLHSHRGGNFRGGVKIEKMTDGKVLKF